jgi:group I intron endonuclease
MTSGIYCIEHVVSKKKYIGKSVNIEGRFSAHKWQLKSIDRKKDCNRYLFAAVKKYGLTAFKFYTIEQCERAFLPERELYWMDFYNSCDGDFGYNLRRDSSSGMEVSQRTIEIMKEIHKGDKNGNFGNRWSVEQKARMSEIAKRRHIEGFYKNGWKEKLSKKSIKTWSNQEKRERLGVAVSKSLQKKNAFWQLTREGWPVKRWEIVEEIIAANPGYKWQNIYAVCNGYKPTYMGFKWQKVRKDIL